MTEAGAPYFQGRRLPPGTFQSSPWELFSRIWTATTGYEPTSFVFLPGRTPMATAKETAVAISIYYLMVFYGRKTMKRRPAFELTTLFQLHNLFLSILSGFLLILFIQELGPGLWKHGVYNSICGPAGWTERLIILYYVNYLTKYFELMDTIFLVLKKKNMTFLHCYHHGATVLLCYTQLTGQTPISWVPITLNLTVHVLMYWYYFQSSRGIRIWWKEWITRLQILQFLIDLAFIYYASFHVAFGACAGSGFAASVGCIILTSYLILFISFYIITYRGSPRLRRMSGADKMVVDVKKQFI